MGHLVMREQTVRQRWFAGAATVLLIAACSSSASRPATTAEAAPTTAPEENNSSKTPAPISIESVDVREGAPGVIIDLSAAGSLVWTSFRTDDGKLVVELPNSVPGGSLPSEFPGTDLIQSISLVADANALRPLTRLTISGRREFEHSLVADGSLLRIELTPVGSLAAAADSTANAYEQTAESEEPAAPAPMGETLPEEAATESSAPEQLSWEDLGTPESPHLAPEPQGAKAAQLQRVEALSDGTVSISGDGEFEFSSFRLDNPERFVIDLQGVTNAANSATLPPAEGGPVLRVRTAQFKTSPLPVSRVVFDLSGPAVPEIDRSSTGLRVRFMVGTRLAKSWPTSPSEREAPQDDPVAVRKEQPSQVEAAEADDEAEGVAPTLQVTATAPESVAQEEAVGDEETTYEALSEPEPVQLAKAEPRSPAPGNTAAAPAESHKPDALRPVMKTLEPVQLSQAAPRPDPFGLPPSPTTDLAIYASQAKSAADAVDGSGPQKRTFNTKTFGSRTIGGQERTYSGEPVTMTLRDADVVETLRSFAAISGLSIVVQPEVSGSVTVELENVPWDQALEQILRVNRLGYEIEGTVMRIAPVTVLKQEAKDQQELAAAKALQVPLKTVMRRLSYANSTDIANLLRTSGGLLSQRGSVIIDRRTNSLIIKELPEFMDTVTAVINELDTPEPQVMIEARVVETTKRFTRTLGVDWGLRGEASQRFGNTTGLVFPNNVQGQGGVNLITGGRNGFLDLTLGNVLNSLNLDISLQAAENEGLIRILSAPKVAVLNNEEAQIQSGLQIPIQTIANNTISTQFINATLELKVTPHVTAEGTVLMDLEIKKREPQLAFAVVGATNAPIATKEAKTRVIVRDGGTTVIGGIYKVTSDQGQDRIPGLANIPIIGEIFKNRRRTDDNEELLIFVTPRVVNL